MNFMQRCDYCLCKVCNKIRCPRGKYHCMPCYHGTVLECPFFLHKKVNRIYHIKRFHKPISVPDLIKLRDVLNQILDSDQPASDPYAGKSLHQLFKEEEQRHTKALKDIVDYNRKNH